MLVMFEVFVYAELTIILQCRDSLPMLSADMNNKCKELGIQKENLRKLVTDICRRPASNGKSIQSDYLYIFQLFSSSKATISNSFAV